MKLAINSHLTFLLLIGSIAMAEEPNKREAIPDTEPTKCFQMAAGVMRVRGGEAGTWEQGLGFPIRYAVDLCSGATDANKVLLCATKALSLPDKGGLGLSTEEVARLCRTYPFVPR